MAYPTKRPVWRDFVFSARGLVLGALFLLGIVFFADLVSTRSCSHTVLVNAPIISSVGLSKLQDKYLLAIEQTVLNAWYQESECFNDGHCWPPKNEAMTMVGRRRLANIRALLNEVIDNKVPGDFVETGAWKGGSCLMALAVFVARDVTDRKVWVCDSFKGIPPVDVEKYPGDNDYVSVTGHTLNILNENSVIAVKRSFEKAGLLNDQVEFLEGWFNETLPTAPINTVAVLRLDGDIYQSTWESLLNLYPKVSPNGYVIVDDYTDWEPCRRAITDYRVKYNITDPILQVAHLPSEIIRGVYWKKTVEGGGSGF